MANYLFNNKKKRFRLVRLEQDLARSIQTSEPFDKQLSLANEIKLGRIRVLKAELSNLSPSFKTDSQKYTAIEKKIFESESVPVEKILEEFQSKIASQS